MTARSSAARAPRRRGSSSGRSIASSTRPERSDVTAIEIDPAARRQLAVDLFNHTWELLDKADRTAADNDEMIHSAHASRFHWGEVPDHEPGNVARGEWLCSRVYAVLG